MASCNVCGNSLSWFYDYFCSSKCEWLADNLTPEQRTAMRDYMKQVGYSPQRNALNTKSKAS